MNSFHIEGRAMAQQDIIRDFMWQFWIPDLPIILKSFKRPSMEDLTFACKASSLPAITLSTINSSFLGHKQVFSGNMSFSNSIDLTFQDVEDQRIYKIFYEWLQKIDSTEPKNIFYGAGSTLNKNGIAKNAWLKLYKYNGTSVKYNYRFHNIFPTGIASVELAYSSNSAIQYTVSMAYDLWTFE